METIELHIEPEISRTLHFFCEDTNQDPETITKMALQEFLSSHNPQYVFKKFNKETEDELKQAHEKNGMLDVKNIGDIFKDI